MKTLYLTRGANILVDQENNKATRIDSARQGIDYIYLVEEPMHVVYGCGEKHQETDAEKGDIIVTFYNDTFKNELIVVKNEQWRENLNLYNKKIQEEKERWAAKKDDTGTVPCCENCEKC